MLKKPIINTLVQILGKGASTGLGLIITKILVGGLGVSDYGFYLLIVSSFIFLDCLADFGTKIIGVREVGAVKVKKSKWRQVVMARLAMGLGAVILGWLGIGWLESFEGVRLVARLALVMVFLTGVAGSMEILWQVKLEMVKKAVMEVMMAGLFLVFLWCDRANLSLARVFGWAIGARLLSLLWGWMETRQWWRGRDKGKIREILAKSWPMGVYLLIFTSYDRAVDSLMIERMVGVKAVAWYGLAYKIYGVMVQPAYFLTASVFSLMAKGWPKRQLIIKSIFWLGMGLAILVPGVYWGGEKLIGWLGGEDYMASVGVLKVLTIGLVFAYLNHLVGFSLISQGGEKQMLKLGMVVLFFNLAANLVVIPKAGIIGAAGVTVATEGLFLVLSGWRLVKNLD